MKARKNARRGSERLGMRPNTILKGMPAELDQQNRRDQLDGSEAQLCAVDGCDADDRAYPVVVDEKRDQETQELAILADVAKGLPQASE